MPTTYTLEAGLQRKVSGAGWVDGSGNITSARIGQSKTPWLYQPGGLKRIAFSSSKSRGLQIARIMPLHAMCSTQN